MTGHKRFAELVERLPAASRARIGRKAAALRQEMPLHELRAALELSQKHLAEILKVDQPAISRMERRTDMMLSTLSNFVAALGGELELRATFPTGAVRITGLSDIRRLPTRGAKAGRGTRKEARHAAKPPS